MGWKAVRDHYRIEHIVQVVPEKGICIGSGYIHDIIVISLDRGEITRVWSDLGRGELGRYVKEMRADPFKLAELVAAEDVFERSIPVFTYQGGEIIEKLCEDVGWPNPTHDGQMQFENTFSTDSGLVRTWAIDSAKSRIEFLRQSVKDAEADLADRRNRLAECERDLATLSQHKRGGA